MNSNNNKDNTPQSSTPQPVARPGRNNFREVFQIEPTGSQRSSLCRHRTLPRVELPSNLTIRESLSADELKIAAGPMSVQNKRSTSATLREDVFKGMVEGIPPTGLCDVAPLPLR